MATTPKTLQSRVICKHDTEENWNKAQNFIPKLGEMIMYDADKTHTYERIKVGDGVTKVSSLPFANEIMTETEINSIFSEVFG